MGPVAGTRPAIADVEEALREVIDPDLGVNVVDLGFVREIDLAADPAVLTMTLTSPACPLTGVMEDQMRTALADLLPAYEVRWVFLPAWTPARITDDGRDQLRAIGFTF
ncbi:metal-sulfur cluster assembly factor [Pseudonocardia acidicola]|uniref:Metal-sulfur cluster assembly factor n=1 Tax=Pseudonocardia acidicola TaxID=2724939 RepID=A0ABX1S652_9PSEU|nr:metal-sulfur cluster assembly factor [Pseudonocardia acidicola]NMH97001.1 metal-sulfur cluster assembly factor [Pseudonocardia acidicola]